MAAVECDHAVLEDSWSPSDRIETADWLENNGRGRATESEAVPLAPVKRHQLPVERAITDSRWILELGKDWDGEGAVPIEEATWRAANTFLRRQAETYWNRHGQAVLRPRISPCADGSIDIHWKSDTFELLVNVRREAEHYVAGFYGDDYDRAKVKGELDPTSDSAYLPLLSCLINV